MSGIINESAKTSLTNTLVFALTQCQEQVRQLAEQSRIIEDLRKENVRLRNDLSAFRANPDNNVEAKYKAQFQDAFKHVAEKQAEVERLKAKLHAVKTKARQHGWTDPMTSSPALSFAGEPSPPRPVSVQVSPLPPDGEVQRLEVAQVHDFRSNEATATRKRQRSPSPLRQPLQEVSPNIKPTGQQTIRGESAKSKGQSRGEKAMAAIPELTEDGDDYLWKRPRKEAEQKPKAMPEAVYHRLGDLLDVPSSARSVLSRARSNSPPPIRNILQDSTPAKLAPSSFGLLTPNTDVRCKRPKSSLAVSRKVATPDPEDEEPIRSRPLNRLGLMHFKLNPATNSGLDYAYNEVVRGQKRQCLPGCTRPCCARFFRVLADTLPQLSGPNGQHLSDHDLLLNHLGPGSEERIRNLTPTARTNLLHDARTKFVADTYGKMHRDIHERGRSPPGFWRTDMPGSQEQREDREVVKVTEREEVTRRYNEAMREGGRWIFADE